MSYKVRELVDFLQNYDGDTRVKVHGVRDGLKYHFHELYGNEYTNPTITVCVEGSRDYQSVENEIEREEQDD